MGILGRIKSMWGFTWGAPGAETYERNVAWNRGLDMPEAGNGGPSDPYAQHGVTATAVSVFAEDAASIEWELYPVDRRSGRVGEDSRNHPLLRALQRPNPRQLGNQLWIATYTDHILYGEAFWYYPDFRVGEVNGPLTSLRTRSAGELVTINPHRVEVEVKNGEVRYYLTRTAGQREPLDIARLTHFRRYNPANPLRGLSILDALRCEIDGDYAAAEWNRQYFGEQNGVPTILLQPGQGANMSPEQRDDYLRTWTSRHGRKRGVGLLPPGWTANDFGSSQREMDFAALRGYSREIILGALGVPPFRAGVLDKANYANARQQDRVYWDAIKRFLSGIQQTLNHDFLPKVGIDSLAFWPDYEVIAGLVDDYSEKLASAKGLFDLGVPLAEVNERLDLGIDTTKITHADVSFLPAGYKNADDVVTPPEPINPFGGPTPTDTTPADDTQRRVKSLAGDTREKRLAYWRTFAHRTSDLEGRFESSMRSYLRELRDEVLDNVNGVKGWLRTKGEEPPVFDKRRANKKLRDRTKPLHKESAKRGGEQVIAEIGVGVNFDLQSPAVSAQLAVLERKIVGINDRIETAINEAIAALVEQPDGTSTDKVRDAVREVFDVSLGRARTIARTEVGNAYQAGRVEGMTQAGIERHEWLSSGDEDVRETHAIDGEVRPLGEPFSNGLSYPNDPGGPADEVINCRCVTVPIVEE